MSSEQIHFLIMGDTCPVWTMTPGLPLLAASFHVTTKLVRIPKDSQPCPLASKFGKAAL